MTARRGHILAFDCSGGACSAAIWSDGRLAGAKFQAMERGHAEALIPQIQAVLEEAGLKPTELDAVATTVGPGSFTGIRIGLAAAKGLALAAELKIMAFTSFEAVLAGLGDEQRLERPVAVAIDSRRGPVFAQLFDPDLKPSGSAASVEPDAFEAWLPDGPVLVLGDGTPALAALQHRAEVEIGPLPSRIRATDLARHAAALGPAAFGRLPATPLYLRPPDVTVPKPPRS